MDPIAQDDAAKKSQAEFVEPEQNEGQPKAGDEFVSTLTTAHLINISDHMFLQEETKSDVKRKRHIKAADKLDQVEEKEIERNRFE